MALITSATILIVFYILLVRIFRTGWRNIDVFEPKGISAEGKMKISIIVSCRNEEKVLSNLIESLRSQTFQDFELVLVNDHSTDQTEEIMLRSLPFFRNAIYIQAAGEGKKRAIAEGILRSRGDVIVTTDADCKPARRWLETIVEFQAEQPSDLVICPVKLLDKGSFFSRLQQFEFTSLAASGAGAVGVYTPILCNAANLVFTKEAWLKSRKDMKLDEQSGDDIFLLQSIKKQGGTIRFLRSKEAFVETEPSENLTTFVRQRRRWAGKSTAYTDWHLIFTACLVFGICLIQLLLLAFSFFNVLYFYFFLFYFALKYWGDTKFLHEVSNFYSLQSVSFYSFCLSLVYPFYIVFTAISALFFKPKRW